MADFNGDGQRDAAVVGGAPGRLAIALKGPGNAYALDATYAVAARGSDLAAGDLDLDGDIDLAVAVEGNGGVELFFNDGNAGFAPAPALLVPSSDVTLVRAQPLRVNDIPDLLFVANGDLHVAFGVGDGTFLAPFVLETPDAVADVRVGDFDGDRTLDIAVVGAQGALGVFFGEGPASVGSMQPLAVSADTGSLAVADWDGDGIDELALVQGGALTVVDPTNAPQFVEVLSLPLGLAPGAAPSEVLVNDATGDLLVLIEGLDGTSVACFEADGSGGITGPVTTKTGADADFGAITSFGQGGELDVLLADRTRWCLTAFSGSAGGGLEVAGEVVADGRPHRIAHADFDGDGDPDLAVSRVGTGDVAVLRNAGAATFAPPEVVHSKDRPLDLRAADLDADGDVDLVVAHGTLGGTSALSVLLNRGDATFDPSIELDIGASQLDIEVADVDDDGRADIVALEAGVNQASVLTGRGGGAFDLPARVGFPTGAARITVVDADGDGRRDIAAISSVTGSVSVAMNAGGSQFQSAVPIASIPFARDLTAADLDQDGNAELIVVTPATVHVLARQGGVFTEVFTRSFFAQSTPRIDTADVNADGTLDLVLGSGSYGSVQYWLGRGALEFSEARAYHVPGIALATVVDLDGDGSPDVAAAGGVSDAVALLRSLGCD